MEKKTILVALSGAGRSLRNLIEYAHRTDAFNIIGVISSSSKAGGLEVAREYKIDSFCEKFNNSSEASKSLTLWLREKKPNLIVLAGFLKVFPTHFYNELGEKEKYKIINIHPSLLPKYSGKGMYGQKVHEAVLKEGEKSSGASVHFVNEVYDEGPLVGQIEVPVKEFDTAISLADRVFKAECQLYPNVIEGLLYGKIPDKRPVQLTYTI